MRSLIVSLPDDLIQVIEAKVAAGEYPSDSDLVREGIETLLDVGFTLDEDPIADIRASCAEMDADPSLAISSDDILNRVRRRALGPEG